MPNKKLLIDTLAHIKLYPEHWDQGVWARVASEDVQKVNDPNACGTAYCLAGWACVINGEQFDVHDDSNWTGGASVEINRVFVNGEVVGVDDRAAEILDISNWTIFNESNTYEDLVAFVALELGVSQEKVNDLVAKRVVKLKARAAKHAEDVVRQIAELQKEFELLEATVNREVLV